MTLYGMEAQFYGVQDEYMASRGYWDDNPWCVNRKGIKKYTVTGKELCFSTPHDAKAGYAYRHVNIKGDPKTIQSVELLIGGQRVDKIYPAITGKMRFSILEMNNMPALKAHEYKLRIEHTGEVVVYVPRFRLFVPFKGGEILFWSTQYNGPQKLVAGVNNVELSFNHPVEKIEVFGDCKCIQLELDGHIVPATTDCKFVFEKTINFSRVTRAILVVATLTEGVIHTFVESKNVGVMNDEMFGVRFSK